jgi:hypothetical protein
MYLPTIRSPCTSPPAATVRLGVSVVEVVDEVVDSVVGGTVVGGSVVGVRVVEVAVGASVETVETAATVADVLVPAAEAPVCERTTT